MSERDSMTARYLHARDRAIALNDRGLLAECEHKLRSLGWTPGAPVSPQTEARAEAEAQPSQRPTARRD